MIKNNWKYIAGRAWSVRLAAITAALGSLEVVLPLFADVVPRGVFAGLSVASAMAAAVARVMDQPQMDRRKTGKAVPVDRRREKDQA
jgi:hypothetical protein